MFAETLSFVQSRIPQITRDWDSQPTDERILRVGLAFFLTLAIAGGIKQRFQRLQKEQSLSIGRRDIVGLALIAFFMNDLHLVVGPPAEWTEAVNKWWLQLVASMDPQTFFAVTIYGSLTTTCILFTAPYMMLDMLHLLGVPLFAQYKLQKRRPKWIDIWNCFKAVFMVYVGILFMTWTSYPVYKFCGVYADAPIPSWGRIGAELLLFLFIEDLGHFIFHWIFHIEPFYGWIHSVHHKHTYPFGLTATYSHPIEVIVLGIPTMIGPSLVKSHLFTFILWTNLRQWDAIETRSIDLDSGYEFPWSLSKWLPLWGGAEFHDAHHAYKTSNYASSFTYLDTLFGTDAAYRKRKDKYEAEKEEEQTEKKAPKTPEKSQKQAVAKSPMKAAQTPKSAWDDWLPEDPSKRRAEIFFLWYSVVWISMVAVIIATQIYDKVQDFGYMMIGVSIGFPCVLLPVFFPGEDAAIPFWERYSTKANVWIWIMSFIGNYFWTHYFYVLLGAKYTFPAWRLNNVPFNLFLITQSYFCTYHTISNMILRRFTKLFKTRGLLWKISCGILILVLSYIIAFMETFTIQGFPYYEFVDRQAMYTLGSGFYAIYFIVSFPMYWRMDEDPKAPKWTLWQCTQNSFAACMIVTLLLDAWKLVAGPIFAVGSEDVTLSVPFI